MSPEASPATIITCCTVLSFQRLGDYPDYVTDLRFAQFRMNWQRHALGRDLLAVRQFLVPMAVSLAFGVLFSTVVTLLVVPSGYMLFEHRGAAARTETEQDLLRAAGGG